MSLPELDPLLPIPDNILRLVRADPSRSLGFILHDDFPEAEPVLIPINWHHALLAVRRRAEELTAAFKRPEREPGQEQFVVGILLRSGYNYFLTFTATIMLRWTPLVLSLRNSSTGIIHIMKSAHATHLIMDSDLFPYVKDLNESSFNIVKISDNGPASQDEGAGTDVWPDYPVSDPDKLSLEARTGLFAFMHTSGHPKIVPWTHQWILTIFASLRRQRPGSIGCVHYTMMPLFHGIGLVLAYGFSIGLAARVHFLDMRQPPTSAAVLRHLALHGEQAIEILLPPSIVEDIVDGEVRQEGLNILKRAASIFIGGAPLRQDVGDFLRHSGVPVQHAVGLTEVGILTQLVLSKEPGDWQYTMFNDMFQYFFKPKDSEGKLRELIVLPHESAPCVINHQDPEGFATNDLWEPHPDPEKSQLWRIVGRADDITVLSNGEKTNNKQLETLLCTSPLIGNAAVFGSYRFLNGALICPPTPLSSYDPEAVSAYLDAVWSHITDNVNGTVPQHSQLIRPLVLVAAPTKPFVLTDKRSLNRKATLSLYVDEINTAYARVEEGEYDEIALPDGGLAPQDTEGIRSYVQALVHKVLQGQRRVALDDDLFDVGLESLLAIRVRSAVVAALRKSGKSIVVPRNIVYSLPTERGLAGYLQDALSSSEMVVDDPLADIDVRIAETIEGCTVDFPITGSLGSSFVSLLLRKPDVRKIYLLNRKSETGGIEERHQTAFRDRGLHYDVLAQAVNQGRAVYLEVALGQRNLGLNQEAYDEICAELTHIVHCAWLLNFNLVLQSFKTHVEGVRNLIDLALLSTLPSPAHLTFLSSIAVVGRWEGSSPPEASLDTPAACLPQGYAHAKYVAEKIIERAVAQRPGFEAAIIRSGQLSGAEGTGAWSRTEHIPILFKSSVDFGLVPGDLPTVRWLPVNAAAEVVYREIQAAAAAPAQPAFYNLENAKPTAWASVAETLAKMYALPIVPAVQWLEHVRKRTDHPANKLLAFFEEYAKGGGLPALNLHRAREAAGDLVDYVVDEELIMVYARYACR
ncbi:hypothetical protein B0H19DRAFT_1262842 [Mycena capillaripes]|nr:hypothetical protein B0H19DRAFT_1262842 [Mycena capillaripes]